MYASIDAFGSRMNSETRPVKAMLSGSGVPKLFTALFISILDKFLRLSKIYLLGRTLLKHVIFLFSTSTYSTLRLIMAYAIIKYYK